jgi:hypothetical protein
MVYVHVAETYKKIAFATWTQITYTSFTCPVPNKTNHEAKSRDADKLFIKQA